MRHGEYYLQGCIIFFCGDPITWVTIPVTTREGTVLLGGIEELLVGIFLAAELIFFLVLSLFYLWMDLVAIFFMSA